MLKKISWQLLLIFAFCLGYLVSKFYYKQDIKRLSKDLDPCGEALMNFNLQIVDCNTRLSFCGKQAQIK